MYKLCKTEQSAARQRELEKGLLVAMGSRQYDEISVSDLCEQMDIPRKSFYRYFSSKDGALHALIDHTLMEYDGVQLLMIPGEMRVSRKNLEYFFRFWKAQKPLLDALERSGISGVLVTRFLENTLSDTDPSTRFLSREDQLLWRHSISFVICGIMSVVLDWHHAGYLLRPEQMADVAMQMLSKPIFVDYQE